MSDKEMPLESRIVKRGSRYSFRAAVPKDVREYVQGGKNGQKWISLRTSDYAEAKRLARIRSVEFDEEIETIQRQQRDGLDPSLPARTRQEVDAETASRIADDWLRQWLEEDDELRDGCRKDDEIYLANLENLKKRGVPFQASFAPDDAHAKYGMSERQFEKQSESTEWLLDETRRAIAKRNLDFIEGEVDAWLTCLGVELEAGSLGWRRVAREMLKAQEAALTVIQERNEGKDIRTEEALPSAASSPQPTSQPQKASTPFPRSQPQVTLDELIEQYMADPAKVRSASAQKTYATIFRALREILGGERQCKQGWTSPRLRLHRSRTSWSGLRKQRHTVFTCRFPACLTKERPIASGRKVNAEWTRGGSWGNSTFRPNPGTMARRRGGQNEPFAVVRSSSCIEKREGWLSVRANPMTRRTLEPYGYRDGFLQLGSGRTMILQASTRLLPTPRPWKLASVNK